MKLTLGIIVLNRYEQMKAILIRNYVSVIILNFQILKSRCLGEPLGFNIIPLKKNKNETMWGASQARSLIILIQLTSLLHAQIENRHLQWKTASGRAVLPWTRAGGAAFCRQGGCSAEASPPNTVQKHFVNRGKAQ